MQMTDRTTSSDCLGAFAAEVDVVYRALRRFGVGARDAEDLVQEVFLVMCRRWADYDPRRALRPWLLGIAFRVARDHRKRPSRELAGGFGDREDASADPDRRMAAGRARALVREALGALSEKQRAVIILHDLDGVAMSEIAGALSAPLTTLYSRLHTARRSFARAVRRLDRRFALVPAATSIESLLRFEQAPEPLAAAARLRVLARTRSAATSLGRAPATTGAVIRSGRAPGTTGPGTFGRALELSGGALLLVLTAAWLWHRPFSDARAAGHRDPGPTAAAPRPLSVRPPRLSPATILLATSGAAPAAPSLAQGLVGYWRFDDGTGSAAARDLSGHATDCLARGPQVEWTAGRFGGAINLTGHGWLECPDPRFGGSPDLTVAAWVKRPRAQRGMRVIATRQLGSGARDHFFFGLRGGELSVASHVWNGPLRHPLPPAGERWVHVAAVHRDGQVTLFIDGAPVASRRSYGGRTVEASSPILIGAGANGPDPAVTTQHFAGAIDELAIYDRPLAADEVAALAAGQQPPLSR
jgi:RNA polymerase sigma-70 factor (ECF subfamily)